VLGDAVRDSGGGLAVGDGEAVGVGEAERVPVGDGVGGGEGVWEGVEVAAPLALLDGDAAEESVPPGTSAAAVALGAWLSAAGAVRLGSELDDATAPADGAADGDSPLGVAEAESRSLALPAPPLLGVPSADARALALPPPPPPLGDGEALALPLPLPALESEALADGEGVPPRGEEVPPAAE
jgi:hypothetical protein